MKLLALSLAVACAGVSALLRPTAEALRPASEEVLATTPLFPPEIARPFAFGFSSLAADVSFLEAIQVHGARKLQQTANSEAPEDRALVRLLDDTTQLDPRFCGAYRFIGSALPRHTVDGKAMNVMSTELLLERGVRDCPDDWRVPFLLGFVQSFYLGHMDAAAQSMALAARRPEAPRYIGFLATRLAADAGAIDLGEQLAMAMEAEASEDATREAWHGRLLDLKMERELRELETAARAYRERFGTQPPSLQALVERGLLARIPEEPHGGRFELLPDGEARSTAAPRLRVRGRVGTQSGLLAQ